MTPRSPQASSSGVGSGVGVGAVALVAVQLTAWLFLAALPACSNSETFSAREAGQKDCARSSLALDVAPPRLMRGEGVRLQIVWEVDASLHTAALATLIVSDETIEVDVPLLDQSADGTHGGVLYGAELVNPFGSAAPPGHVVVLATAPAAEGCRYGSSATSGFVLE